MLKRHPQCDMKILGLPITLPTVDHRMISHQELCRGTNNFCESNLLETRGFSSMYKVILFDVECRVLRAIRRRNLVKVISTRSNHKFRALVLQYMSNGSLEKCLYSHNYYLILVQRVNIMVEVAFALEYLHNGQATSVVHCDLKRTNILLDEDMVAYVGDFGIAKILVENKDAT